MLTLLSGTALADPGFGVDIDHVDMQPVAAGYEWTYIVTGLAGNNRGLSHWTLGLPDEVLAAYVDGSGYANEATYNVELGYDPSLDMSGIKFEHVSGDELDAAGETHTFHFTVSTAFGAAALNWGAKDGSPEPLVYGTVLGPSGIPSPTIAFSPSSFSFSATEGGASPPGQTLSIWNSGGGILNWSVSDNATWLTLSPTSGSSTGEKGNVAVSVDISGMNPGSYWATITISAEGATNTPQTIPVSLTINLATNPATSVPVFPSIYALIVAVVATGGLGYFLRKKWLKQC